MRVTLVALALVVVGAAQARAQAPAPPARVQGSSPSPAGVSAQKGQASAMWSVAVSAYTYFVPDSSNYVQPSFTTDRGWLHLEARANYEDLDTGSVWLGRNFAGGDTLTWEVTPMLGAVFGNTGGIAPGYRGSVGWWKLELASEGEYVLDVGESSDSFFYNWSELTVSPVEWFRTGLVTQRTRAYASDREIQRGLLVGVSCCRLDVAAYVFNPDDARSTVVVAVSVDF